jgi:glycosyltransferase involved in cell wall biosynthesis
MQRMNHYVEILTYGAGDDDGFEVREGVIFKNYKFQNLHITALKCFNETDINFYIFNDQLIDYMSKILQIGKFDIVHVGHPLRLGSIIRAASCLNIPVVLTLTDFWLMCPKGIAITNNGELCYSPNEGIKCSSDCFNMLPEDKMRKRFNEAAEVIDTASVVVSPTYFLANIFKNTFNKEVKVIRHGIDYTDIKPNCRLNYENDMINFAYIGTVIPHKGVHIVIEAIRSITPKNICIKIYGHYFHEKSYYMDIKKASKDDARIQFLGEYRDDDLKDIMNDIDCILVPSIWWENSPLTLLTGLAFKIPVVTIDIGGGAELINNGINGFNFEIGNPSSLANIIENIAKNPAILNNIRRNIVRPPRNEEEAFEYENIYRNLARK